MRRRFGLTVLASTALLAGPLVVPAAAAVTATTTAPSAGQMFTSQASRPAAVSINYSEAVAGPGSAGSKPTISVTRSGAAVACPLDGAAMQTTSVTCTFSSVDLLDGVYEVAYTAQAVLLTGGTTSGSFSFTIDTTAPVLLTSSPANGRSSQGSAVSGSYDEPLASGTISVKNGSGATLSGTTSVQNGNTLRWLPSSPLTEAGNPYAVTAKASDAQGHARTSTWTFTVDRQQPSTPTLTVPAHVNSGNAPSAAVTGSAEPGSTVAVSAVGGATATASIVADNAGAWSTALDLRPLTDGPVAWTATSTDEAGNTSAPATAASAKDTVAPPLSSSIEVAPSPVTAASTLVVVSGAAGAAEPGTGLTAVITRAASSVTSSGAAQQDGSYALPAVDVAPLSDGSLAVSVIATDAAGNTTTKTTAATKKTALPSVLTLAMPSANTATAAARTVSGTASSDASSVEVAVTDASGGRVGPFTLLPGQGGAFSRSFDLTGLADGPLTVRAVSVDAVGNRSAEVVAVAVKDTAAPAGPVFTAPTWINAAAMRAFVQSGTAEPSSAVSLTAAGGGKTVGGATTAASDGSWNLSGLDLTALPDGPVTLTVTATDAAGNTSTAASGATTKDSVAPATPSKAAVTSPVVTSPMTVSGTGTSGDAIAVTVLSDGGPGTSGGTGTVAAGSWSLPVDVTGVADGLLAVTAVATDPAGNSSAASAPATPRKDTTRLALTSTAPADQAQQQQLEAASATFNEQLSLAASTVTLVQDATAGQLATHPATLSPDKRTLTVTPVDSPLPEGDYTLTFAVSDASELETATAVVHVTVDRSAPAAPTVGPLPTASSANSGALPVSVTTAETGGNLTITIAGTSGTPVTRTVAVQETAVSTTLDVTSLPDGALTATAQHSDQAGNTTTSTPVNGSKDATAPGSPSITARPARAGTAGAWPVSGTGESGAVVGLVVGDGTQTVTAQVPVIGGTWSTTMAVTALNDGPLSLTATQTDSAGNTSDAAQASVAKDTVAPTVTLLKPSTLLTTSRTLAASWSGADAGTGVATYDVRYRRASWNGGFSEWTAPSAWTRTTALSVSRLESAGYTTCFSVRSRDSAGNVSGWSPQRCAAVPLDDRSLTASAGWTRATVTGTMGGTVTRTSTVGATLTLASAEVKRVAIVATTCPTCGSVDVYVGGRYISTVSLASATTRKQVLLPIPPFTLQMGPVVLKTTTAKPVEIDGLTVTRQ